MSATKDCLNGQIFGFSGTNHADKHVHVVTLKDLRATGLSYAKQQEEFAMAIVVEAGKTECLYQDLSNSKYVAFELDYQVAEGGNHDINFMIRNPAGIKIIHDVRRTEANHRIEVGTHGRGDYAICFDNSFSMQTEKTVFFELYLLDKNDNYLNNFNVFADLKKAETELSMQISNFDQITTNVKNNLNRMEQLQAHLRAAESRDRSMMENNFERVNFWSFVNLIIVVFVSALQVYLLRSLFDEYSTVGCLCRLIG